MISRRAFLKYGGLLSCGVSACTGRSYTSKYDKENYNISKAALNFPKIKAARNRIIKETVGLRPFRSSGPRIELQEMDQKKIIHNYGHGGSGWSLSWGSALLAAELAETTNFRHAAVIGCGVIGLSTARLLQSRGFDVTIYTRQTHPYMTSSVAAGNWSPTSRVCDLDKVTPELQQKIRKALFYSYRTFQSYLGVNDVVGWIDTYRIRTKSSSVSETERELKDKFLSIQEDPYPHPVPLHRHQHPFLYDDVSRTSTNIFNIPAYLKLQMDDFLLFGGKIHIKEFKNFDEILSLKESLLFNCTGLGAMELCEDQEMRPIAGQLAFLIPQPEVNYRVGIDDVYFIPRKDGIMLGGNALDNVWSTTPDPSVTEYFISRIAEVMDHLKA